MTIWAKQHQIAFTAIAPATVDMFDLQRHTPRRRVALRPTTTPAFFAILLNQVTPHIVRYTVRCLQTRTHATFPFINVTTKLLLLLTPIAAVYLARTFYFVATTSTSAQRSDTHCCYAQGRIRTAVPFRDQIYSLTPLTTRPPVLSSGSCFVGSV